MGFEGKKGAVRVERRVYTKMERYVVYIRLPPGRAPQAAMVMSFH